MYVTTERYVCHAITRVEGVGDSNLLKRLGSWLCHNNYVRTKNCEIYHGFVFIYNLVPVVWGCSQIKSRSEGNGEACFT